MITRTADVDLFSGKQELIIDNLPAYIIDDSVRVMGQGSVKAKISGVKVKKDLFTGAPAEEDRGIAQRIRKT